SWDKSGSLAAEGFPNLLGFRGCEKSGKKMRGVGMQSIFEHTGVVRRRNHRLDPYSVPNRRALQLGAMTQTIRDGARYPCPISPPSIWDSINHPSSWVHPETAEPYCCRPARQTGWRK